MSTSSSVKKILVIKPSGIGDIVHALPAARAVKMLYPGAALDWVVFTKFSGIFRNVDFVDGLVRWDRAGGLSEYRRVLGEIRSRRYDIAIDLQGLLRTAFLNRFSGARRKFASPLLREFAWLVERPAAKYDPSLHAVERNYAVARRLSDEIGAKIPAAEAILPWLKVPPALSAVAERILGASPKPVLFGVASRGRHKIWPAENFAQLINGLAADRGITPVIVGTRFERKIAWEVSRRLECRFINIAGEITLAELPAVAARCVVTVGNDSGIIHIAAALGRPVLGIFGATNPVWYRPYNAQSRYIYKNFPCSPCDIKAVCKDFRCMRDITVADVRAALEKDFAPYL